MDYDFLRYLVYCCISLFHVFMMFVRFLMVVLWYYLSVWKFALIIDIKTNTHPLEKKQITWEYFFEHWERTMIEGECFFKFSCFLLWLSRSLLKNLSKFEEVCPSMLKICLFKHSNKFSTLCLLFNNHQWDFSNLISV